MVKGLPAMQEMHKRHRFNPWVGKIPWSRKWQPAPVFLPGKSHGQRNLVGYSLWGCKELDMTEYDHLQMEHSPYIYTGPCVHMVVTVFLTKHLFFPDLWGFGDLILICWWRCRTGP